MRRKIPNFLWFVFGLLPLALFGVMLLSGIFLLTTFLIEFPPTLF